LSLGNTQPGDGKRYKGRGPIQLTGRSNYRAAGAALGLDLEENPVQASTPAAGFRVAAWYWSSRNINEPADRSDFETVTRRINGGLNGYADRTRYYSRALELLK
jgi:putative chitinase